MTARQLPPESVRFRGLLIRALWDDRRSLGAEATRSGYISADHFIGICPVCGAAIGVRFAGYAPRATLNCHGGCSEDEIATQVGLGVHP